MKRARTTRRKPRVGIDALSPRERQVLAGYMAEPNAKIAAPQLGISYQTFKNHVTSILDKLGVERMGQAAVLFDRFQHYDTVSPDRRWHERRIADRRIAQAGSGQLGQGGCVPVEAPPDTTGMKGARRGRKATGVAA